MKKLLSMSFLVLAAASIALSQGEGRWRTVEAEGVRVMYQDPDLQQAMRLATYIKEGKKAIKRFFGKDFKHSFETRILPDRKSLTEFWRIDWKVPDLETQCWMIASGTASKLTMLSPRVWKTEACEHDPDDVADTRLVVAHELVHVYHGQRNPKPDFEGLDDLGWFIEGLAVYASGQLSGSKLASAKEAIEKGKDPKALANAWSGRYRYGVSGSIIKYIDLKYGRKALVGLLGMTNQEELLKRLGTTEKQLLEEWRRNVSER